MNLFSDERKIGFVILHYNNFKTTVECIDSILGLEQNDKIEIVIVDNHSLNGSGKRLKEHYNIDNVKVVILDKNYGFSKANNIGFRELVSRHKLAFIVVANNDIIFKQKEFIQLLEKEYIARRFYVAGPDVFSLYKKNHQSPLRVRPRTELDTLKLIKMNKKKLKCVMFETVLHWIWLKTNKTKLYQLYKKHIQADLTKDNENEWENAKDNNVLHGSCLFFSSDFIDLSVKPFEPEPFFYYEEDILAHRCLTNNWKISYLPQIKVMHLEGASTNAEGYYRKMKFRYTNIIKSAQVYLKYLRDQK